MGTKLESRGDEGSVVLGRNCEQQAETGCEQIMSSGMLYGNALLGWVACGVMLASNVRTVLPMDCQWMKCGYKIRSNSAFCDLLLLDRFSIFVMQPANFSKDPTSSSFPLILCFMLGWSSCSGMSIDLHFYNANFGSCEGLSSTLCTFTYA